MSVKSVDIPEEGLTVWLREFGFVRLYRTTLKNEHRHYALYLPEGASLDHVSRSEFEAIMIRIGKLSNTIVRSSKYVI